MRLFGTIESGPLGNIPSNAIMTLSCSIPSLQKIDTERSTSCTCLGLPRQKKRFGNAKIVSGYDESGRRLPSKTENKDSEGVRQDDVWHIRRVPPIKQIYPTEKPLKLLERIVGASSNEGDLVLDPFCGWWNDDPRGSESRPPMDRHRCMCECLQGYRAAPTESTSTLFGLTSSSSAFPRLRDDAKVLADIDKFRFERWAAALVDGMEPNKRQRGDKGIDGWGRFPIRKGPVCRYGLAG